MQYSNLGRSGIKVSPQRIGTMTWGAATGQPEATRIVDEAIAAGIYFIDTTDAYHEGRSEEIVSGKYRRLEISPEGSSFSGRPGETRHARYNAKALERVEALQEMADDLRISLSGPDTRQPRTNRRALPPGSSVSSYRDEVLFQNILHPHNRQEHC